jgi:arabinogalactan oligomer/maltooligosaccharide transport system permease protein
LVAGAGQVANRQYGKALAFFACPLVLCLIEVSTGDYHFGLGGYTFRDNGGFFTKGMWGLLTLGTQSRRVTLGGVDPGDHSIILLANGILATIVLTLAAALWVFGVRDAAKVALRRISGLTVESSRAYFRRVRAGATAYGFIAPAAVLIALVTVIPVLFVIAIAFTNYDRGHLPPGNLVSWVGLENFARLGRIGGWADTFFGVVAWTVIWALAATATTYLFGFIQAVLVNTRGVLFPKLWRTIFILPWAVPAIVSTLVFRSMMNGQFGPISQFFLDSGLTTDRINWLSDPQNPNLARIVVLLVNLWLGFPFFFALISSCLTAIKGDYYDAASVDGASTGQITRHITLPLVLKMTSPLLILSFVSNFNNFGVIFFLTDGGPTNPDYQFAGQTDILVTWLFRLTVDNRLYDVGAALAIVVFVVVGIFSVIALKQQQLTEDDR